MGIRMETLYATTTQELSLVMKLKPLLSATTTTTIATNTTTREEKTDVS